MFDFKSYMKSESSLFQEVMAFNISWVLILFIVQQKMRFWWEKAAFGCSQLKKSVHIGG